MTGSTMKLKNLWLKVTGFSERHESQKAMLTKTVKNELEIHALTKLELQKRPFTKNLLTKTKTTHRNFGIPSKIFSHTRPKSVNCNNSKGKKIL